MTLSKAILGLLPLMALACAGTSTGNPMGSDQNPDNTTVPKGATRLMSDAPREENPELSTAAAELLGAGNRAFAFELYRELAATEGNLLFSPYSISVALAMTLPGAQGSTETEMRDALHFELPEPDLHSAFNATSRTLDGSKNRLAPESTGDGFDLSVINQAWGQINYPFLDPYLDVLGVHYGAGLFAVNFADSEPTRQLINDWVEDQTRSRVAALLPAGSITLDTRLVLTNAIYFKASWLLKFDPAATQPSAFHAPAGDTQLPMMQQKLVAQYAEGENYQALELPYVSPDVRMLLILPSQDLASLAASLDDAFFRSVRSGLDEYEVTATLPKFKFESERKLKAPLSALGMPTAFKAETADFTAMAGGVEPLWIDEVYHKAFVAVDEQGTEAAAATAVVMVRESAKPSAQITFDRPFLFLIYDDPTGQLLFLGHFVDPA